ncbi:MAG: Helix-turn-helix domain [Ferruginibacter sp.]|uniref:helix-turn-helix domain-containing protein n=1 Tax=Ferruginibacter sp. TaxID=1940288 RepID=UPI0026583295|nr:helix-turn-helix transcriptional regulator [Ferruginibacter sp.]MDB5279473.1 Helix-turn-helix domain [Ferruginibacter sp.]
MHKIKTRGLQNLVAQNIIELRKKKNILQKDLAIQLGIKTKELSLIENGHVDLPLSMLEKLAVIFKVPVEVFLLPLTSNDRRDEPFIDKARLLDTIDKSKLNFVLNLLDIFIDNKLEPQGIA